MSNRPGGLRADVAAGIMVGVAAVPDAIASAVLAGINPAHGLIAVMVGMPIAAVTTSSVFLVVTTTSALALTTQSALAGFSPDARASALMLVTIVAGVTQLTLGLLRAGMLTHFISNAVMTGFFAGVAIKIVLGQLPDLAGYAVSGQGLMQTFDLLRHVHQTHVPTMAAAALTIALILGLERTRLAAVAMLAAIATTALMVWMLGWRDVALLGDATPIPRALPHLIAPDVLQLPQVAFSGIALAALGLIQGAGIGQTIANPDGRFPNASRDFTGQGLANLASGLFGGMPIGGSMSATALSIHGGARSRWTQIACTSCVVLIVLIFGGLLEQLPVAALASVLMLAGIRALDLKAIGTVWNTSWPARAGMMLTMIATLTLAVSDAVLLGVAASFALELYHSADRVRLVELVPNMTGTFDERPAPLRVPHAHATLLMPYGTLSFAGARRFETELPDARDAANACVIILLRGREELGSTFFRVVSRYAHVLQTCGGRLMLAGVSASVRLQLARTGLLDQLGSENVFDERPSLGAAAVDALATAQAWLRDRFERHDTTVDHA